MGARNLAWPPFIHRLDVQCSTMTHLGEFAPFFSFPSFSDRRWFSSLVSQVQASSCFFPSLCLFLFQLYNLNPWLSDPRVSIFSFDDLLSPMRRQGTWILGWVGWGLNARISMCILIPRSRRRSSQGVMVVSRSPLCTIVILWSYMFALHWLK